VKNAGSNPMTNNLRPRIDQHRNGRGSLAPRSASGIVTTIPSAGYTCLTASRISIRPTRAKNSLLWLVYRGAVGFGSWTPTVEHPDAVRYARMLFRPNVGATDATLRTALQSMRTVLQTIAIDAVPLLEGRGGALFIPFAGAPSYEAVRAFLNSLVLRAAASIPDTIVPEHKPHEEPASGKIEVTVRSNAPGRFSSLPYALLGGSQLSMVTPVSWQELDNVRLAADEAAIGVRLQRGDVFAQLAKPLARQRFRAIPAAMRGVG
jgi:DNA primase